MGEFADKFNCDAEKYFEENGLEVNGNIVKELNLDEILIFTIHESEGIPATYFSWVEPDGRIIYHTVAYDVRGDAYTYVFQMLKNL